MFYTVLLSYVGLCAKLLLAYMLPLDLLQNGIYFRLEGPIILYTSASA